MSTISGKVTVYDLIDKYLGDDWDKIDEFGRLQNMTFEQLIELYIAINTVNFPSIYCPSDQLILYLGKELDLHIILCSLLHAYKVIVQYPIQP